MAQYSEIGIPIKRKLLFIIPSFSVGGKERQLVELIKALPKDRFEIHLFAKSISQYNFSQIKSFLKSWFILERKNFSGLKSLKSITRYFKEKRPDIVHSWSSTTSVYCIFVRFLISKKFILIEGGIRDAWFPYNLVSTKYYIRLFINLFSDIVVTNSLAGINDYLVFKRKAICIYNGYDFNRIKNLIRKEEVREKFGINNSFVIGMVARFFNQKDWIKLIDIANAIISSYPEIKILCVGGGPNLSKTMDYAKNSRNVVFTYEQSDVESIINCFDVGILITDKKHHAEGIPNALMEYMSLQKPCIANDTGGTSEILVDGETGFLVRSDSIEEYIDKINLLYVNPELRKAMGLRGMKRLQEVFSIHKMIDKYVALYTKYD